MRVGVVAEELQALSEALLYLNLESVIFRAGIVSEVVANVFGAARFAGRREGRNAIEEEATTVRRRRKGFEATIAQVRASAYGYFVGIVGGSAASKTVRALVADVGDFNV